MQTVTYDEFEKQARDAGLLEQFSQWDLDTAKKDPSFGMNLLSLKKDWRDTPSDEDRMLLNIKANDLRKSYGYTGGADGSQYIPEGSLLPKQLNDTTNAIADYSSFSYEGKKPEFKDEYAPFRTQMIDDILNREEFSWNKETDPQWSSYKKQYLREGDRATQNTLGQASAASGGRASSYAVGAASQAGDYYATKLSDMIPTLYQQAYDKYLNEYQMKLSDLNMLNTQTQMEHGMYQDEVAQFNRDREFAQGVWQNNFGLLQGKQSALQGQDGINYAREQDQAALARQQEQAKQSLQQAQIDAILSVGGVPSAELVAGSGYSNEYVQAMVDAWQRENGTQQQVAGRGTVTDSAPKGNAYNEGLNEATVAAMQEFFNGSMGLNLAVDGSWGPASRSGTGYTAQQAYNIYQQAMNQADMAQRKQQPDRNSLMDARQDVGDTRATTWVDGTTFSEIQRNLAQYIDEKNLTAATKYLNHYWDRMSRMQQQAMSAFMAQNGFSLN